jgi:DNA-binding response OmpR family regulator
MRKKLLVVDDEEDILTALKSFYKQYDVDVTLVTNGKDCIKKIEQGFSGIVLIDIMMPQMDGWQTINELVKRGLTNKLKIKIITGKGTRDHSKIASLAPYIDDYIGKPFTHEMLLSIIE